MVQVSLYLRSYLCCQKHFNSRKIVCSAMLDTIRRQIVKVSRPYSIYTYTWYIFSSFNHPELSRHANFSHYYLYTLLCDEFGNKSSNFKIPSWIPAGTLLETVSHIRTISTRIILFRSANILFSYILDLYIFFHHLKALWREHNTDLCINSEWSRTVCHKEIFRTLLIL